MLIGGHVSTAGGPENAPERAWAIGGNCMQIFGSSPRQWKVRFPQKPEIAKYKERLRQHGIEKVYLHAPYLINLASPNKALQRQSFRALRDHFKITNLFGAEGLIFHMGSHKGQNAEHAVKQTADYMKKLIKEAPGKSWLVMETSSGGGNKLGDTPEELGQIAKLVKSDRVKVCFDTAHAFTAGVIDYSPASIKEFIKKWKKEIGLDKLAVVHANDSKAEFGSAKDRHENIGEGRIGLKSFKELAKHKEFSSLPWILEVPGFDGSGPDKKNVNILKKMLR